MKQKKHLLVIFLALFLIVLLVAFFFIPKSSLGISFSYINDEYIVKYGGNTYVDKDNYMDNCWETIYAYEINHSIECPYKKIGWFHRIYATVFYKNENSSNVIYGTGTLGTIYFKEGYDPYAKTLTISNNNQDLFEARFVDIIGEKTDLTHGDMIGKNYKSYNFKGVLKEEGIKANFFIYLFNGEYYITFPDGMASVYKVNSEYIELFGIL